MRRLLGTLMMAAVLVLGGVNVTTIIPPPTGSAIAAERTVTLAVNNLKGGCPPCAFIVSRALSSIDGGVRVVKVSARNGTAIVKYDDAKTDIGALTQATAAAGFPSRPSE